MTDATQRHNARSQGHDITPQHDHTQASGCSGIEAQAHMNKLRFWMAFIRAYWHVNLRRHKGFTVVDEWSDDGSIRTVQCMQCEKTFATMNA